MAGHAVADHLTLMARSGLMTHVADLEPPVTAAAMARFRAEAGMQASNVMALSPGQFALCLPAGLDTLATRVPHRLRPIEDYPTAPPPTRQDGGSEALPARRILPPGLRQDDPAPAQHAGRPASKPPTPAPILDLARPPATAVGRAPDPLSEGQVTTVLEALSERHIALAASVDRVGTQLDVWAERHAADLRETARTVLATVEGWEARLGDGLASLPDEIAERLSHAHRAALDALAAELRRAAEDDAARTAAGEAARAKEGAAAATALEERIVEAMSVLDTAQRTGIDELRAEIGALSLARAEDEARLAEGFAAMRLGLRALNDRMTELSAQVSERRSPPETPPETAPVTTDEAVPIPLRPPAAPRQDGGMQATAGERPENASAQLRAALSAVLAELDARAQVAGPTAAAHPPAAQTPAFQATAPHLPVTRITAPGEGDLGERPPPSARSLG
ncbi:MAG: hypothetical protein AAGJ91_02785 [Pseudomonadota bacterium]